jgi:thiol-disulfide isomerase/thioredoxin
MSFFNRFHLQLSLVFLTLGVLWIGLTSILFKPESNNSTLSVPQKGFLAPDFRIQSLQGVTFTLSEQKEQVVLLNIWASWCTPCKAEMPAMQRVYDTYKDQGFTILAVNATTQDSLTAVI